MAKLNVVNSKTKSKKPIHLDKCGYGALVKINGAYCIVIDCDFEYQNSDEVAVLDIETGEVLFFNDDTPVRVYYGEVSIDEEQFREFE